MAAERQGSRFSGVLDGIKDRVLDVASIFGYDPRMNVYLRDGTPVLPRDRYLKERAINIRKLRGLHYSKDGREVLRRARTLARDNRTSLGTDMLFASLIEEPPIAFALEEAGIDKDILQRQFQEFFEVTKATPAYSNPTPGLVSVLARANRYTGELNKITPEHMFYALTVSSYAGTATMMIEQTGFDDWKKLKIAARHAVSKRWHQDHIQQAVDGVDEFLHNNWVEQNGK